MSCTSGREAARAMLFALPDELLQLILAKLDAAAACRLSQVDKAFQQWILFHHKEWVHEWRQPTRPCVAHAL